MTAAEKVAAAITPLLAGWDLSDFDGPLDEEGVRQLAEDIALTAINAVETLLGEALS